MSADVFEHQVRQVLTIVQLQSPGTALHSMTQLMVPPIVLDDLLLQLQFVHHRQLQTQSPTDKGEGIVLLGRVILAWCLAWGHGWCLAWGHGRCLARCPDPLDMFV